MCLVGAGEKSTCGREWCKSLTRGRGLGLTCSESRPAGFSGQVAARLGSSGLPGCRLADVEMPAVAESVFSNHLPFPNKFTTSSLASSISKDACTHAGTERGGGRNEGGRPQERVGREAGKGTGPRLGIIEELSKNVIDSTPLPTTAPPTFRTPSRYSPVLSPFVCILTGTASRRNHES